MTTLEVNLYLWGCYRFATASMVGGPVVVKCPAMVVHVVESIISARTDLTLPTTFGSSEFGLNYD
jgi:hypothetical protein